MANSSAIEEYLQVIYTLADEGSSVIGARIAEFLGVSAPAVSEMLHRLEREGLVTISDRHEIRLTAAGQTAANTVVRRHRLIERFLVDILGYEWWKVHDEAERLEHALSPEMEERMRRVLGDPSTCPHGNPMPGVRPSPTRTLGSLGPGQASVVERIPDQFEHEPGFLEYLESVGLRPGVSVTLVSRTEDALRVSIGGGARDVRADCAQKVWVRA
ncbi:MAG TPA: metal-dependent transcriptional regulator [Candidatus Limnocylindria bacterium]|nr:metal-dependent transcriptional regulator [Candidatus Limnocylindria bacterium]